MLLQKVQNCTGSHYLLTSLNKEKVHKPQYDSNNTKKKIFAQREEMKYLLSLTHYNRRQKINQFKLT